MADTEELDQAIASNYKLLDLADRSIQRLIELAQKTGAMEEITDELKKRKAEQVELKGKIASLEAQRSEVTPQVTPEALAVVLQSWRESIEKAHADGDLLTAKRLISYFVQKVELGYNKARIYYTFPDFNPADEITPLWGHLAIGKLSPTHWSVRTPPNGEFLL